jgi:YD repeat-containing protein
MKYPLEGTNSFYSGYGNSDFLERHYTSFDRRGMWKEVLFYAPMYSADQKTFYLRDEFKNTIKYEYDNRGNRTRETSYNGQEKICETVRKFDADNHLIDEKVQCVNEIHTGPEMRVKYTKSKKGTKEEYYNAEDESKSNSLVTLYDDRGNIIEKETLDYRDKVSNKTTYKYDGRNNKIEEVHYENPKLRMVTEIRYDDRGNQIADSNYNNVNNVGWYSRNSYVYDTAGNWIENTYVYLGQRIYIIKRQINYY